MEDHIPPKDTQTDPNKIFLVSFDDPEHENPETHHFSILVNKLSIQVFHVQPLTLYCGWNLVDLDQITKTKNGFICFTFIPSSCTTGLSHKYLQVKDSSDFSGEIPVLMEMVAQALANVKLHEKTCGKKLKGGENLLVEEVKEGNSKFSRTNSKYLKNPKKSREDLKKEKRNKISENAVHETTRVPENPFSSAETEGEDFQKSQKRKYFSRQPSENFNLVSENPTSDSGIQEKRFMNQLRRRETISKLPRKHTRTSTGFSWKSRSLDSPTEEVTLNRNLNLSPRSSGIIPSSPVSPRESGSGLPDMETRVDQPKNLKNPENGILRSRGSAVYLKKGREDSDDRKSILGKSDTSEDRKNGKIEKKTSLLPKFKNLFQLLLEDPELESGKVPEGGLCGRSEETEVSPTERKKKVQKSKSERNFKMIFPEPPPSLAVAVLPSVADPPNSKLRSVKSSIIKYSAENPTPPEKTSLPEKSILPEKNTFSEKSREDFPLNTNSSITNEASILGENQSQNGKKEISSLSRVEIWSPSPSGSEADVQREASLLESTQSVLSNKFIDCPSKEVEGGEGLIEEDGEIMEERRKERHKNKLKQKKLSKKNLPKQVASAVSPPISPKAPVKSPRNRFTSMLFGKEKTENPEIEFRKNSPRQAPFNGAPPIVCNCVMCQCTKPRKLPNNENIPPTSSTVQTAHPPISTMNWLSGTSSVPEKSIQNITLQDPIQGELKQNQKFTHRRDPPSLPLSCMDTNMNLDNPKTDIIHQLQEKLNSLYKVYNILVNSDIESNDPLSIPYNFLASPREALSHPTKRDHDVGFLSESEEELLGYGVDVEPLQQPPV